MIKQRLGELLVQQGLINDDQLRAGLAHQKQWSKKLGESLIDLGYISESALCERLAKALRLPTIDLTRIEASTITRQLLSLIPLSIAREHHIVPIASRELRGHKRLIAATTDPTNYKIFEDLQFKSGLPLLIFLAPASDIEWFIRRYYLGEEYALSQNYISTISRNQISSPLHKTPIDPISAIFEDSEFTNVTKQYRGKDPKK